MLEGVVQPESHETWECTGQALGLVLWEPGHDHSPGTCLAYGPVPPDSRPASVGADVENRRGPHPPCEGEKRMQGIEQFVSVFPRKGRAIDPLRSPNVSDTAAGIVSQTSFKIPQAGHTLQDYPPAS